MNKLIENPPEKFESISREGVEIRNSIVGGALICPVNFFGNTAKGCSTKRIEFLSIEKQLGSAKCAAMRKRSNWRRNDLREEITD